MFRVATDEEAQSVLGYTTAEARARGHHCHTWKCEELGTVLVTRQGDLVYYCDRDALRVEAMRSRAYGATHAATDDGRGLSLCGAIEGATTLDDYDRIDCQTCRVTLGLEIQ